MLHTLSQCCGDCCDPLSGLGTIPLPGVDAGGPAAYLLQVENHSLQDGVERLPAALPSGRCQGGESSSDISLGTERGEKATPPSSSSSQPCHNARHPTPPPGRAARQHCPRAPEPVQAAWLADGAAGRGAAAAASRGQRCAVLSPVPPLCSLPRCLCSASPLPPCSGMGTRQCCLPGNTGFEGRLHLITSRQHQTARA